MQLAEDGICPGEHYAQMFQEQQDYEHMQSAEGGMRHEERKSSNGFSQPASDGDNSDEDDLLHVGAITVGKLPPTHIECFSYFWQQAIAELTHHLRDDDMLPLAHRAEGELHVCGDMKSGIVLPTWHCPFLNYGVDTQRIPCQAQASKAATDSRPNDTHEKELWSHARDSHILLLQGIIRKWKLQGIN